MTGAVAMAVVWKILFSGDQMGLINNWLMNLGVIDEPIIWLTSATYLLRELHADRTVLERIYNRHNRTEQHLRF